MTRRRREAWGWLFVLAGALGCDDGDSIPIQALPAAAEDAVCAHEVRCGRFPDKAACAGAVFVRLQLQADVAAGKVVYDGRAAAECLHA